MKVSATDFESKKTKFTRSRFGIRSVASTGMGKYNIYQNSLFYIYIFIYLYKARTARPKSFQVSVLATFQFCRPLVPKDWFQQNPGLKRCMDSTEFLVTCQQIDWLIQNLSHSTMSYYVILVICFTHVQVHTSWIYGFCQAPALTWMEVVPWCHPPRLREMSSLCHGCSPGATPPWWRPGSDDLHCWAAKVDRQINVPNSHWLINRVCGYP